MFRLRLLTRSFLHPLIPSADPTERLASLQRPSWIHSNKEQLRASTCPSTQELWVAVMSTEMGLKDQRGVLWAEQGVGCGGKSSGLRQGWLRVPRLGSHCVKGWYMCCPCPGAQMDGHKCQARRLRPDGMTQGGKGLCKHRSAFGQPVLPAGRAGFGEAAIFETNAIRRPTN